MPPQTPSRRLLCEGKDDLRLVPEFIEANGIRWGEKRDPKLVDIQDYDGIENLLRPGEIETQLKASNLRALGILLDADDDPARRWHEVRARCVHAFPAFPEAPPPAGLVLTAEGQPRLGVWLMPDNQRRGMLETFLALLLPRDPHAEPLWQHACDAHQRAVTLGAPCHGPHTDKARIHTWLAWRDPPGRQLHDAIKQRIFDPRAPEGAPFLRWFCALYEIPLPAPG